MFGKVGLDYFVTNKTTLSISGIKVHGEFKPNETIDITTDSLFNYGIKSTYSQRLVKQPAVRLMPMVCRQASYTTLQRWPAVDCRPQLFLW